MADFCNQCADDIGLPRGDLAGLISKDKIGKDYVTLVICEGC
jgi:hypothetical protein